MAKKLRITCPPGFSGREAGKPPAPPMLPRITFGPDTGERFKGMSGGGYMAVDTEYGLMEIRDGHVYLNGVDVGEVTVAAKDEADTETAEFLTKYLHWMSRTK